MNEELSEIISLVSRYTDVPRMEIILGRNHIATRAKGFVCHLVRNAYPHLTKCLSEITEKTTASIWMSAEKTEERIQKDKDVRLLMNEIRKELKLPLIKPNPDIHYISNTKRMFGFDYTDEDVRERRIAIINARIYMDKKCRIGRQPIPDGLVFASTSAHKGYNKWYNA